MHTSVLLSLTFDDKQGKWVVLDPKKRPPAALHLEISVWSIVSLSLLVGIASLFVSHTTLNTSTAVLLTALYSFTCMLVSNEFMLSDWHTLAHKN
jgi:hypothetical protein